ncbi:MAG: FMN-binding negative transcriptional regulator [Alphaproteobacteria bacterium]
MYVPPHFKIDDPAAAHALIEHQPFGTLVVNLDGRLEATHLPFLLDRSRGTHGTLRAHMARANPAWHAFESGAEALVIFLGPEGYISPDWYESEQQVPTWNYVAAHAYGVPRALGDEDAARIVDALSARHEGALLPKPPWTSAKLDPDFFAKLRRAIVAFEIGVTRIEMKAKLSQNKTASDIEGAAAALEAQDDASSRALGAAMRAAMPAEKRR